MIMHRKPPAVVSAAAEPLAFWAACSGVIKGPGAAGASGAGMGRRLDEQ